MSSNSMRKEEVDMTLKVGDLVGITCTVQNGPFPDELLVSVETKDGVISGFVKQPNLKIDSNDSSHALIKGSVVEISKDEVTVRLFGSFFTTAQGVASVTRGSARRLAA